jgi:hypothetical protein
MRDALLLSHTPSRVKKALLKQNNRQISYLIRCHVRRRAIWQASPDRHRSAVAAMFQ